MISYHIICDWKTLDIRNYSYTSLCDNIICILQVVLNKKLYDFHHYYFILTDMQVDKVLLVVGLDLDGTILNIDRQVVQVSLERPDKVKTIGSSPAWVPYGSSVCMIENTLFAVGLGEACNELWKWTPTVREWIRCEDMTSGRQRHSVAVVDYKLYVLGGWANKSALSSVLSYNIGTNKWTAAGQLVHAAQRMACVVYKDLIYLFGGKNKDNKDQEHVQVYNPALQSCTLMSSVMPRADCQMRAVLWETSAVLIGFYTCFIYNFETQTWQERQQFTTDVAYFGLVLNNQTVFVAGGGTSERDKDNKVIWTCSDEIKCVSILDIMADKPVNWKHHAKLPKPALIQAYSQTISIACDD